MKVRVRFFAATREAAKAQGAEVELAPDATVQTLLHALAQQFPALAPLLPKVRVAVDEDFADPATPLRETSDVALIPPVAGG